MVAIHAKQIWYNLTTFGKSRFHSRFSLAILKTVHCVVFTVETAIRQKTLSTHREIFKLIQIIAINFHDLSRLSDRKVC